MIENELKGKTIFITGGTGSFGYCAVKEILKYSPKRIIVFSRDENKQYKMTADFKDHQDILRFVPGDVRNLSRVREAMIDVEIVIHASAMKQIPIAEKHPFEAVSVNILGAYNVKTAAMRSGVKKVIMTTTDKAVNPISAMGMTKALGERIILSNDNNESRTKFACVRYGNIIGSRGSIIEIIKDKIEKGEPVPLTPAAYSKKFWLRVKDSVDLVFYALENMKGNEIFVRKTPICSVADIVRVMAMELTGRDDYPVLEIKERVGDKLSEVLVSNEEMGMTIEDKDHFTIYYPHRLSNSIREYSTFNAMLMNDNDIKTLLKESGWI